VDVTFDIPAWATRLKIATDPMTNVGQTSLCLTVFVDGAEVVTGYKGATSRFGTSTMATDVWNGAQALLTNNSSAAAQMNCDVELRKIDGERWIMSSYGGHAANTVTFGAAGTVALTKQPGQVRLKGVPATTFNGTVTLTAEA
jgi:hypothetical protein